MTIQDETLDGRVVLVTRPAHQAGPFIQMIENRGGKALSFPTIEINALEKAELPENAAELLELADLIVFTSANAVACAEQLFQQLKSTIDNLDCQVAAIGRATTKQLDSRGVTVSIQPQTGYDSEALLDHIQLQSEQIKNKRILLIKGAGGRDKLATTLRQRGAKVDALDVYRRQLPQKDLTISRQQLIEKWSELCISGITVTSNESLQNLYQLLQGENFPQLLDTPLIVPSKRAVDLAQELGFRLVCQSISAHDKDMLDALMKLESSSKI